MKNNLENSTKFLLRDHSWKAPAIAAALCLGLFILLNSVLFAVAIELIKVVLIILALLAIGRSAYLGYPILKKKYEEESAKKSE